MPATSMGAAIRITVDRQSGPSPVYAFRFANGNEFITSPNLNVVARHEQRKSWKRDLLRVCAALKAGKGGDFASAAEAIRILHSRGRQVILDLFSDRPKIIKDIIESCRSACPGWQRFGWDNGVPIPALVDIESPIGELLPFELLPIFDFKEPEPARDLQSLGAAASCFAGFSAIVRRTIPETRVPSRERIRVHPKLGIQFFRHAGLRGAVTELRFMRQHGLIRVGEPWPETRLSEPQFRTTLAESLLLHSGDENQVSHFACHCDTDKDLSEDYSVTLAAEEWFSERTITIGELRDEFAKIDYGREPGSTRSLVFFNACGSSEVDPGGLVSFPQLFLRYGHRGFVGTEIQVPDTLAAEFSTTFYTALLEGVSLGAAVYRTRWNLLKRLCNPLGILYSVYADPDLIVETSS